MSLVSKTGSMTFQLSTVDDLWLLTWGVLSRNIAKCIGNSIVKKMDQKTHFKLFLETPDDPVDPKLGQSLDFTNIYKSILGIFEIVIFSHFMRSERADFGQFFKIS